MAQAHTITIGNIKLGGKVGENPTVLIGSIFYDRHKIVQDTKTGDFDEDKAQALLESQDEWSARTGCPAMVDVIASSPTAARKYLAFVAAVTDSPILVDGSSPEVRIAGLEYCAEAGLLDRTVYNSLTPEVTAWELDALRRIGCPRAVLLCLSSTDFTLAGRLKVLEGDGYDWPGLLTLAHEAGITEVLVDPGIIDVPGIGVAKVMMATVKEKYGLVTGSAPHNAVGTWVGLREKMGAEAVKPCTALMDALIPAWGGDFTLYGPIRHAGLVFPAVALVDACLGHVLLEQDQMPDIDHPLFKIA